MERDERTEMERRLRSQAYSILESPHYTLTAVARFTLNSCFLVPVRDKMWIHRSSWWIWQCPWWWWCCWAAATTMMMVVVSSHGVPTAEMFAAETLEEYQHLLSHGGYSNNETLRDQVQAQRQRATQQGLEVSQPLLANAFGGVPGFYHGVASGDPLPNAIILWTRYTPLAAIDEVTLELRIATVAANSSLPLNDHLDPARNPNIKRVLIEVTGASDWVAKVDVTGLPSRTKLVYAFSDGTTVSDIGQTTTAPTINDETVSELRYAVFSCANYGNGYFHAYDVASTITDLDFWIHLGDYIVR
jgi:hypothetical protein